MWALWCLGFLSVLFAAFEHRPLEWCLIHSRGSMTFDKRMHELHKCIIFKINNKDCMALPFYSKSITWVIVFQVLWEGAEWVTMMSNTISV
jgi:hypothetical protein